MLVRSGCRWIAPDLRALDLAPHLGHVSNFCGVKPAPSNQSFRVQINGIHLKFVCPSTLGTQLGGISNRQVQIRYVLA